MKIKYEYLTLGQLGDVFGETSHTVGKWLLTLGLRFEGKLGLRPTKAALDGGYVKPGPSRNQGYNWVWHAEKTVKALLDAGHRPMSPPPAAVVAPEALNGPFATRPHPQIGFEVVSGDGTVAVWVHGEENARVVAKVLTVADKHGLIGRLTGAEPSDGETPGAITV